MFTITINDKSRLVDKIEKRQSIRDIIVSNREYLFNRVNTNLSLLEASIMVNDELGDTNISLGEFMDRILNNVDDADINYNYFNYRKVLIAEIIIGIVDSYLKTKALDIAKSYEYKIKQLNYIDLECCPDTNSSVYITKNIVITEEVKNISLGKALAIMFNSLGILKTLFLIYKLDLKNE